MLRNESESPKKDIRIEDGKIYFYFIFYLELRVNIMQRRVAIWILGVIYKSTCPENYIPVVMLPLNYTSPPSTVATCLATRLMAVLQPSGYSIFYGGDTPIRLSLL